MGIELDRNETVSKNCQMKSYLPASFANQVVSNIRKAALHSKYEAENFVLASFWNLSNDTLTKHFHFFAWDCKRRNLDWILANEGISTETHIKLTKLIVLCDFSTVS